MTLRDPIHIIERLKQRIQALVADPQAAAAKVHIAHVNRYCDEMALSVAEMRRTLLECQLVASVLTTDRERKACEQVGAYPTDVNVSERTPHLVEISRRKV